MRSFVVGYLVGLASAFGLVSDATTAVVSVLIGLALGARWARARARRPVRV